MLKRPTWELKNMVKALSMHPWLNTTEETHRLETSKQELARRNQLSEISNLAAALRSSRFYSKRKI
jgi:predicted ATPase